MCSCSWLFEYQGACVMQNKWFTKCVDKSTASLNSFVKKYIEVEGMKGREDILTPDMEYSDIFFLRSI